MVQTVRVTVTNLDGTREALVWFGGEIFQNLNSLVQPFMQTGEKVHSGKEISHMVRKKKSSSVVF